MILEQNEQLPQKKKKKRHLVYAFQEKHDIFHWYVFHHQHRLPNIIIIIKGL
jgi:hypothetical protein